MEEDVDACSERAGIRGLQLEVRDGLPSDGVFLVVQGEDDLGGVLESLDGVIGRDEIISGEEHEFQKDTELGSSMMAGALGVLIGPQAKVENQYEIVRDVSGFLIGGVRHYDHNRENNTQRYGILLFKRGVFDPICFEFPGKALV